MRPVPVYKLTISKDNSTVHTLALAICRHFDIEFACDATGLKLDGAPVRIHQLATPGDLIDLTMIVAAKLLNVTIGRRLEDDLSVALVVDAIMCVLYPKVKNRPSLTLRTLDRHKVNSYDANNLYAIHPTLLELV